MALRTVTGILHHVDGTPWTGTLVTFEIRQGTYHGAPPLTYPQERQGITTDSAGAFSLPLTSGLGVWWVCRLPDGDSFMFALNDGPTVTIEALRADALGEPVPASYSTSEIVITASTEGQVLVNNGTQFVNTTLDEADLSGLVTELDTLYVHSGAINAKGDLIVGGSNDQYANLPVGSPGQLLTADPAAINGVSWGGGGALLATTRTLPAGASDTVEIGSFFSGTGAFSLRLALTVDVPGFSASRLYDFATSFASTGWRAVRPLRDSGTPDTSDFELLARAFGTQLDLKIRRVAGANTGPIAVRLWDMGVAGTVFTESSTTGTDGTSYGTHAWPGLASEVLQTRNAASYVGLDTASPQSPFPAAQSALTLPRFTVWDFDAWYGFDRTAGTTSHTISTLFGGTATFDLFKYTADASSAVNYSTLGDVKRYWGSSVAAHPVTPASTSATEMVMITLRGSFTVGATAGTLIPQIQYSAAPGGTMNHQAGTYFRCWPVGRWGIATVGPWGAP